MPRSASVRVLSGLTRRSRDGSAESGSTTQRTPAGTDPTARPLAASLTNSSPPSGPPIDAFANPTEADPQLGFTPGRLWPGGWPWACGRREDDEASELLRPAPHPAPGG